MLTSFIQSADSFLIEGPIVTDCSSLLDIYKNMVDKLPLSDSIEWAHYIFPLLSASKKNLLKLAFEKALQEKCPPISLSKHLKKITTVPTKYWANIFMKNKIENKMNLEDFEVLSREYYNIGSVIKRGFDLIYSKPFFENLPKEFRTLGMLKWDVSLIPRDISLEKKTLIKHMKALLKKIKPLHKRLVKIIHNFRIMYSKENDEEKYSIIKVLRTITCIRVCLMFNISLPIEVDAIQHMFNFISKMDSFEYEDNTKVLDSHIPSIKQRLYTLWRLYRKNKIRYNVFLLWGEDMNIPKFEEVYMNDLMAISKEYIASKIPEKSPSKSSPSQEEKFNIYPSKGFYYSVYHRGMNSFNRIYDEYIIEKDVEKSSLLMSEALSSWKWVFPAVYNMIFLSLDPSQYETFYGLIEASGGDPCMMYLNISRADIIDKITEAISKDVDSLYRDETPLDDKINTILYGDSVSDES